MPNELMKTLTVGANTYDLPQKTSDLTNDSGFLTSYTETDPTVPSWAKASSKPTYTKSEVGLGNVDNVKQYSASNPPPYPVTSVNGQTGAVTVSVPTKVSDLTNDSGFITGMTILSYGSSTWNDFIEAYNANKVVYCRASSNANPASGSQTRLAFMAYVNNATTPTNVEFQYYRSVSSHTASQQGDQVFVYKLDKKSGWSVITREASVKVVAGAGLGGTYSNGTMTLTGPTKVSDLTNDSGFITGYTETDPVFSASAAAGITSSDISDWNGKADGNHTHTVSDITDFPSIPSLLTIYPVGAIYISTVSTSPASLFGGTWEQLSGQFLLASSSTHTAGSTGGSETVTLTLNQIPSHQHKPLYMDSTSYKLRNRGNFGGGSYSSAVTTEGSSNNNIFTANAGGGQAHDNMPPYLAVYMWKRTA